MLLFYLDTNQSTKHAYISRWRFIPIGYKKGVVNIPAFEWALGTHGILYVRYTEVESTYCNVQRCQLQEVSVQLSVHRS